MNYDPQDEAAHYAAITNAEAEAEAEAAAMAAEVEIEVERHIQAELRRLINAVVAARENEAALQTAFREKAAEFETANAELLQNRNAAVDALAQAESVLRGAIRTAFQRTGNKKPAPGCGVRVGIKLVYHEGEALKWAKEHGLCLALDKKNFEAVAKSQQLDFVQEVPAVTATIATDLQPIEEPATV